MNYHDIKLEVLSSDDLQVIEIKSSILTLDECFSYLLLNRDDIKEEDLVIAERVWKRGRLSAVHKAGDKLFSQMTQRGGAQAAFDYLRQMSPTFQAEITTKGKSGFSFNVVIDE